MLIKRFRVLSYKSFSDSGWIDVDPGINLVIGQNNSGKTALLESIAGDISNSPHRDDIEFRPEFLETTASEIDIVVSAGELSDAFVSSGTAVLWPTLGRERIAADIDAFFAQDEIELSLTRDTGNNLWARPEPFHRQFADEPNQVYNVVFKRDGTYDLIGKARLEKHSLHPQLRSLWARKIFAFNAQRLNVGRYGADASTVLLPGAQNLPAVLFDVQGKRPNVFARLVEHVREIFSTIDYISVAPSGGSMLEILVWPTENHSAPELSFGLDSSGTGVSQVIAILTVALTYHRAVIVIDEISSFLHPAAVKTLLRILRTNYENHQYIISTHSPEVMSSSEPSKVYLVKKEGFNSSVTAIDLDQINDLRFVAGELGISPTDVFAADRIVWVEGPTEDACFAHLLRMTMDDYIKTNGPPSSIPTFIAVCAPTDFTGKKTRPELVFEIYRQLSKVAGQLVRSVTFSFDREQLSTEEMKELEGHAGKRLLFFPRRMFECFLLHPEAIARAMNAEPLENPVSIEAIEAVLVKAANGDYRNVTWLKDVDAANLLTDLFREVSESKLEFKKTKHTLDILKHLLEIDRDFLRPLIDYVHKLTFLSQDDKIKVETDDGAKAALMERLEIRKRANREGPPSEETPYAVDVEIVERD